MMLTVSSASGRSVRYHKKRLWRFTR